MVASRSVGKLGRKTLLALIDHITQVLPGPRNDFVPPLLQDYIKALAEILSRQAHVELLARKDGNPWQICVDFFLDVALYALPEEPELGSLPPSRASPALGTIPLRSTGRSNFSTQSQKHAAGYGEGGPLKDVLEGLYYLVQGANAPIRSRIQDITDVVLRVLGMKQLSLGSLQTLGFGILNYVFAATQIDNLSSSKSLARNTIPLMSYWWRAEKVSQDEVIRALRNEISKSIHLMHQHFESLAMTSSSAGVSSDVEDLAEPLWTEYSKRSEAFRLQLSDVTFTVSAIPITYPQLKLFGLRPHNEYGESHWAVVQNLAFLESVILRSRKPFNGDSNGITEQPRKKRRMLQQTNRIRMKLKAVDVAVRRTALQVIPFLLARDALDDVELTDLLPELVTLAADKNPVTASWAMVACAR